MAAPARPRTNTPAHTFPTAGAGRGSDFANDPFIRRLASPASAERDRLARRDIIEGLAVLQEQRTRADIADEYYDGEVGMVYASQQVRKLLLKQGVAEDDVQDFNYARIPVDEIANRLQIAAVKVAPVTDEDEPTDDEDDDEASADEEALQRAEAAVKLIRHNNRLDVYEKALHKTVSKHGEAFLLLWPVEDDAGKVVSVDFRVNTAHNVAFMYDPEDPLRVAYVIKSWETPSDFGEDGLTAQGRKLVYRANLYYPGPLQIDPKGQITQGEGRVERWVTEPDDPPTLPGSWHRLTEARDIADMAEVTADEFSDPDELEEGLDDEAEEAFPPRSGAYDQAAVDKIVGDDTIVAKWGLTWFHFRNDVPCGQPEHVGAYGPQTLINKLIWSYAGVIEYQGFPQRYVMVDPKIDDPLYNDLDPDHPEDEDDDPEGEGGTSGLKSDPGSVWRMFGKSTGQYSAADPDTFMKPLDRFIKSMAELTGQPLYAFTKNTTDMPSGEAAREMNAGRNSIIEDRQSRYDPEWQDAYELALRMLGIDGVAVDVRWKPAAPINDLNGLQVLKAKAELGVPSEVLLNEAGYPDDQIDAWLKEHDGLTLEQRITLLSEVGTAVQALASGVTAGIVSDNQMQAFISRIIGNLADGTAEAEPDADPLPAPTFRDPPPVLPPGGMGGPGAPGAAPKKVTSRPAKTAGKAAPAKAQPKKAAAAPKKAVKAAPPAKPSAAGSSTQGGKA